MAYKDDLRIATVKSLLREKIIALIDAVDGAARLAAELTDAQNGATVLAWARTLFGLADTGNVTLTVTASTKTISCQTGANYFSGFRVGRDVQLTNFTNAGNNQTVEIKSVAADRITLVDSSTGWVDETDTNARVQENPTQPEQDEVTGVTNVRADMSEMQDALDNVAVATANRRAEMMDWVW